MSRFIDRLPDCSWPGVAVRGRALGEAIVRSVSKSPVIVADGVLEYFFSRVFPGGLNIDLADCPNAAPPFPTFWIEAKFKRHWTVKVTDTDTNVTEVKPVLFPETVAAMVTGLPADEARAVDSSVARQHGVDSLHCGRCLDRHPDARWVLDVLILLERDKYAAEPMGHLALAVDAHGRVLGDLVPGLAEQEQDPGRMRSLRLWLSLMLTTISFIHCKNIRLDAVDPPPKLNKRRARDGKRPLMRYHTLSVGGMARVLDGEGRAASTGIKQALHICRGHFKTFTPDKPLLGKHVGTYWWQQQARGRSSEGVVVKDYAAQADSAGRQPGVEDDPAEAPPERAWAAARDLVEREEHKPANGSLST